MTDAPLAERILRHDAGENATRAAVAGNPALGLYPIVLTQVGPKRYRGTVMLTGDMAHIDATFEAEVA